MKTLIVDLPVSTDLPTKRKSSVLITRHTTAEKEGKRAYTNPNEPLESTSDMDVSTVADYFKYSHQEILNYGPDHLATCNTVCRTSLNRQIPLLYSVRGHIWREKNRADQGMVATTLNIPVLLEDFCVDAFHSVLTFVILQ